MNKTFKRKSDSVLNFLHINYRPFSGLMARTLLRADSALRVIRMRKGEIFNLVGNDMPDYFYVIQGKVRITKGEQFASIDAIDDLGSLHFFPPNRRPMEVEALSDSTVVQADSELMAELINWNEMALQSGLFDSTETEACLDSIRKTKAFCKLPVEVMDEVFQRLERIEIARGMDVIKQGDRGEAFYLIISGTAEVWRQDIYDDAQKLVATLGTGDAFGEESLLVKGTCNATVRMVSDGVLFRLNETDFHQLVAMPLLNHVSASVAHSMLQNGYRLLDVRYEEEYDDCHIPGASLIPLPELRGRIKEIDPAQKYLVICAGGKRASVGALLLRQHHVKDVHIIEGGMHDWNFETASSY
ncbi:MAG: cyclic nucleotide-binding domain-containing protein [Gammaproteobacteria bacterium]|nr:cyclic nucleotide-binding domain-containing protein [Gammaproteobacteria bacterium]